MEIAGKLTIICTIAVALFFMGAIAGQQGEARKYEVPKEVNLISRKLSQPDTLIAYMDRNGTIHFGFKH